MYSFGKQPVGLWPNNHENTSKSHIINKSGLYIFLYFLKYKALYFLQRTPTQPAPKPKK